MQRSPAHVPTGDRQPERRLRRRARIIWPVLLVVLWLVGAGIGGPYFGRVGEVSTNDATSYLPGSSDAAQVQRLLPAFTGADAIPAVIVFTSEAALGEQQLAGIRQGLAELTAVPGVGEVSPAIPSGDGRAAQAFATVGAGDGLSRTVDAIRSALLIGAPAGVSVFVTGPAGFVTDLVDSFAGIDGLLLLVALIAVFVILILVYRSLLLPVAVLSTSLFALCLALLTVWWLAKSGVLMLSGQTQGILFILVIGASTDYSLLFVSRYREELRVTQDRWSATLKAWRGTVEPVVASGSTVIAGLLCLLLSDLRSNSTLGPVASVGIVFAILASLSFLPSLLFLFGRTAFWPHLPKYEPEVVAAEHGIAHHGIWARLAGLIRTHPRPLWLVTGAVLAAMAVAATGLKANGVPQSDLVLGASQARAGQVALGEHFPGGSGSPVMVAVPQTEMQTAADVLLAHQGVTGVSVISADSASGTAPVTARGVIAFGPAVGAPPAPTVVDGMVLLQGTLEAAADSDAAAVTVRDLRRELSAAAPGAIVGGVTATAVDTNDASIRDRNLIIPLVLGVILVILMLLLRSVLAPVLLVLSTMLSYGSALGVAALVFNGVFRFPGADPAVPLYGFVFLVALGVDYNIFLMTRVREESVTHGTRDGILRGLAVTGGVITSAGVVLAATFAALGVIPVLFLAQIAFIVAFGVLLDTFVVRTLLVPALTYDIGRAIWWPSALARK